MAWGERGIRADTEVGTIAIVAGGVVWAAAVIVGGCDGAGTAEMCGAGGLVGSTASGIECDLTAAADWSGDDILVRNWPRGKSELVT